MPLQPSTFVLVVFCLLWGAGGSLFFHFHSNAPLKRRLYPAYVLISGAAFSLFLWRNSAAGGGAIALITLANLVLARFCDTCGRALYLWPFGDVCPNCGAENK